MREEGELVSDFEIRQLQPHLERAKRLLVTLRHQLANADVA